MKPETKAFFTDIDRLNRAAWVNGAFHAGLKTGDVILLATERLERFEKGRAITPCADKKALHGGTK